MVTTNFIFRKEEKMNKEKKDKKEKKKIDMASIFKKIIAALLVIFMLLGTCYTFIYLVLNA